jgi:hypothetical protein
VLAGQWGVQEGFFREHRPAPWFAIAAFNAACLLGVASHATFAFWYLATLPWTAVKIAAGDGSAVRKLATLALWHALPLAVMAVLYLGFLRGMAIGGGPESSLSVIVCRTLSLLAGGPAGLPGSAIVASVVAAVAVLCLVQSARRAADEVVLYLLAILLVPAAVLAVAPIAHYAIRYLLVPSIMLLLLITPIMLITLTPTPSMLRLPSLALASHLLTLARRLARTPLLRRLQALPRRAPPPRASRRVLPPARRTPRPLARRVASDTDLSVICMVTLPRLLCIF